MSELKPGDTVLVRGVMGRDGIVLGPGIEIGPACLNVVGEVPIFDQRRQPVGVILFYPDRMECQRSLAKIANDPGVDVVFLDADD